MPHVATRLRATTVCLLVAIGNAAWAAPPSDPLGNDARLHDVFFLDQHRGWAVGDQGTIWSTRDGGAHWHCQQSSVRCPLYGVSFTDYEVGWAVGGATAPYTNHTQGVVLGTNDGGQNWKKMRGAVVPTLRSVRFFDRRRGLAAGDGSPLFASGVLETADGGRSWQPVVAGRRSNWPAADLTNVDMGLVSDSRAQLGKIRHGQLTLLPVPLVGEHTIHAVCLAEPNTIWLGGTGGLLLHGSANGSAWHAPANLPAAIKHANWLTMASRGAHLWIAGSPGSRILHSEDGGHQWQWQHAPTTTPLRSITFVDERHGWAVGDLGTIVATADGGQTWRVQRTGGTRVAVLCASALPKDVPWEFIAKMSAADGYLTAVSLAAYEGSNPQRDATGRHARAREAMAQLGATMTDADGQFVSAASTRPGRPDLKNAPVADRERAAVDYLVRQLRIWRPDIVFTAGDSLADVNSGQQWIQSATLRAIDKAADPSFGRELIATYGLSAWQVKRVFGQTHTRGSHRLLTQQLEPQLGQSTADFTVSARGLLAMKYASPPTSVEFLPLRDRTKVVTTDIDFFAGLPLAYGSEARRQQRNLDFDDLQRLKFLAQRRELLQQLMQQGNQLQHWREQLLELVRGLDQDTAGRIMFQLASLSAQRGEWSMAAEVYQSLARRYPHHVLRDSALVWMLRYYVSSEALIRDGPSHTDIPDNGPLRSRDNDRPVTTPDPLLDAGSRIQLAAAEAAEPIPPLLQHRATRWSRVEQLGEHLEATRPDLFADPVVRLPLSVVARYRTDDETEKRHLLALSSAGAGEVWRDLVRAERWIANPGNRPSPLPRWLSHRAEHPPHLDGRLSERIWRMATPVKLVRSAASPSLSQPASECRLAHDGRHLYLAINAGKHPALKYADDNRPRSRDTSHIDHDRVTLHIDVDRDYTTTFTFTIDHRGWASESCWDDPSWNPRWYVAAWSDDHSWNIEAAIPWQELTPEIPTQETVWVASVTRSMPGQGCQAWRPTDVECEGPASFGLLSFP